MPIFTYSFTVNAPLTAVSDFHHDTKVLKKLTPLPLYVHIHDFEPLADGSKADMTLWVGPIPIKWVAVHSNVSIHGFTDTQIVGPLKKWQHTHKFTAVSEHKTLVEEHIEYQHHSGWRGLFTRMIFFNLGLYFLFTARKIRTKWDTEQKSAFFRLSAQ